MNMHRSRHSYKPLKLPARSSITIGSYSSREDAGLRVHRTIYNENADTSRRRLSDRDSDRDRVRDRNDRSLYSSRHVVSSSSRRSTTSSSHKGRVEATHSSRLSSNKPNRPHSRSRSPVTRSADDLRNAIGRNGRKSEVYECKTCGPIPCPLDRHIASVVHERRYSLCKLGCRLCGIVGFSTYPQYREHIRTEQHKVNKNRIHGGASADDPEIDSDECDSSSKNRGRANDSEFMTVDAAGCFQEELKQSERNVRSSRSSRELRNGNTVNGRTSSEDDSRCVTEQEQHLGPKEVPEFHDPTVAYGVECIQPIKGMYCRLCKKFFTSEKAALELHAKSAAHFAAYKRHIEQENQLYFSSLQTELKAESCECPYGTAPSDVAQPISSANNGDNNSFQVAEEKHNCLEQIPQVDPSAYENEESA